jgi:hypothetical protein
MRGFSTTVESSVKSRLVLRAALLAAACALTLAPVRAGQSVPPLSSMLNGAVTYTLPEGWHISMYINTYRSGSAEIRNTKELRAKSQARLFLSAMPLPEKKTVGETSGDNYGSDMRKVMEGTVLSDKADSEEWRTVVSTLVQHGEPYLMLEHFGVVDDKYVSATVVMPLGSGDVEWMKKVVTDFNAVCESIKVNGRGSFENRVSPDIITEQLKAGAKK